MTEYTVPGSQFDEAGEAEQSMLVAIPPGFQFATAQQYNDGVIYDGKGGVAYSSLGNAGSVLRIVIKRKAAVTSSV